MAEELIQFNYEEEEDSQMSSPQFQRVMQTPTTDNDFFSFHNKSNDDYRDQLIRELITRNNELEQFTAKYHQLLQKCQVFETNLQAKDKEIQQLYQVIQSQGSQSDLVSQIHNLNQKIQEISKRNQILVAEIEQYKQNQSSNSNSNQNQNQNQNQHFKDPAQPQTELKQELLNMKDLVKRLGQTLEQLKSKKKEQVLKEYIDKFVQTTIQLDEIYYQLLSLVDEQSIQKDMKRLEMLSSKRKMFLEKVYIELQEID